MDDKLAILQAKKIGLFIRQAREISGHSVEECSGWLNISHDAYLDIEKGVCPPSLPQMESLAYFLDIPFESLIKGPAHTDKASKSFSQEMNDQLITLRTHVIAAMVKQQRVEKGLSLEQLAETASISTDKMKSYEDAIEAFSFTDLEKVIDKLGLTLDTFFSTAGPFNHPANKSTKDLSFLDAMPKELQAFIIKPVNRPYLELALRLSQMEADKLRSIATSLLEITY
jgi:transcriptional regulator with XRE-family HTH domain